MKMSPEMYASLEQAITSAVRDHYADVQAFYPTVSPMRFRWDVMWASKWDYGQTTNSGLNDTHIDSALKRIFRTHFPEFSGVSESRSIPTQRRSSQKHERKGALLASKSQLVPNALQESLAHAEVGDTLYIYNSRDMSPTPYKTRTVAIVYQNGKVADNTGEIWNSSGRPSDGVGHDQASLSPTSMYGNMMGEGRNTLYRDEPGNRQVVTNRTKSGIRESLIVESLGVPLTSISIEWYEGTEFPEYGPSPVFSSYAECDKFLMKIAVAEVGQLGYCKVSAVARWGS